MINDEYENLTDEVEEEKLTFDMGDENNFAIINDGEYFYIAFDKLFGMPNLEAYNCLDMTTKRNFKNLIVPIYQTYTELFLDEDGEFKEEYAVIFFKMLKAESDIMSEQLSYNSFVEILDSICSAGDGLLIKTVEDFVESNYALNLDEETQATKEKKRKVNTELQLTDTHAKELLKIAYLSRILIPFISIYFFRNKGNFVKNISEEEAMLSDEDPEALQFDDVNAMIFQHIFEKFSKKPEALKNKLYRLSFAGVSKTSFSDKKFWLIVKNLGITEKSEALDIFKKLLTNAIPKLSIDPDRNVVSFLQSVINNQVDFLFQNKFRYKLIAIGNNETNYSSEDDDDSAMSEFERMEILQTRKNEGDYLISQININDTLEHIVNEFNVGVSDAEVKDTMQKLKRNQLQEVIVSMLTYKYFDDKNAINYMTLYQYCYLLIACKKYLISQKYRYLPLILTAICERHRERTNISGKKVRPMIIASKKYNELLSIKYPNFKDEIERPFFALIGTIHSSVFKDYEGNELFDATIKVQKIADEIVNLALLS